MQCTPEMQRYGSCTSPRRPLASTRRDALMRQPSHPDAAKGQRLDAPNASQSTTAPPPAAGLVLPGRSVLLLPWTSRRCPVDAVDFVVDWWMLQALVSRQPL